MEMVLHLLGLIFILAHVMFWWSFSRSLLVQGTVVVSVVISSIKARIGGNHWPNCSRPPPATHLEALIKSSIAIVKANGEMVHPTMMPTSRDLHAVVKLGVVRQNYKSWKQCFTRFVVNVCPQERMRNWSKDVVQFLCFFFSWIWYHITLMLKASWKAML